MAYLTLQEITELKAFLMQAMSRINEPCNLTKSDWHACLNAVDEWIEDNKASYLAAIPEPAKSELTNKQKAWILFIAAEKRYNIL